MKWSKKGQGFEPLQTLHARIIEHTAGKRNPQSIIRPLSSISDSDIPAYLLSM